LDEALSEKIRNYLTDRIEEIKEGTFVPSWDQFKDLPEFVGTYRSDFINARDEWFKQTFNMSSNKWYKQNFHMSLSKFSSRLVSNFSVEKNKKPGLIALMCVGILITYGGTMWTLGSIMSGGFVGPSASNTGLFILGSVMSVIGISIIVAYCVLSGRIKNEMQKKIDSMSQSDLAKMFDCPSSGNKSAVHLIKLVKDQILVKQSCPTLRPYGWTNKVRLLRIPLRLKDQCVSYFRDAVFRCFKCGQEATVDLVKFSGPWTLIKLSCPTHGNKLPTHKIWSTIFTEISNEGIATPKQVQPQPIPSEEKRFCRNCGEKYKDAYQKVCQNCGTERYI